MLAQYLSFGAGEPGKGPLPGILFFSLQNIIFVVQWPHRKRIRPA